MQELDLHARHVDARRAFALASLAADAQLHRLADLLARDAFRPEPAREREPQRVRAPACEVLLVARDAVARAHRAGVELAAVAVVVAHLDGLGVAGRGIAAGAGRADAFRRGVVLYVPRAPVERGL